MLKYCGFIFGLFITFCAPLQATTIYFIAPEEQDPATEILTPQGMNHALLLAGFFYRNVLIHVNNPAEAYFLVANPQYMRSGSCNNYLQNPADCTFDVTAFQTLDPTAIYFDKHIFAANPQTTTPQRIYPSTASSATNYATVKNELTAAAVNYSVIFVSWPKDEISALISNVGCSVPTGFSANPGQMVQATLIGSTCSGSSLIEDDLHPASIYPNYMHQNALITAHWATTTDKYIVIIRHAEKWSVQADEAEPTCMGLNRALMVPYYFNQKYGVPDVIIGGSLTKMDGSNATSRFLAKISPSAIFYDEELKIIPVDIHGTDLQNLITNLVDNPNYKLIEFGWESQNGERITNAIITGHWNISEQVNSPYYWNANDYDQNIVLHYTCTAPDNCVYHDSYLTDEDYGDILPTWCGVPSNS